MAIKRLATHNFNSQADALGSTIKQQQMTKISEQLEEEKKKSVIELERKMRQRRMQRERTVMELVRYTLILL